MRPMRRKASNVQDRLSNSGTRLLRRVRQDAAPTRPRLRIFEACLNSTAMFRLKHIRFADLRPVRSVINSCRSYESNRLPAGKDDFRHCRAEKIIEFSAVSQRWQTLRPCNFPAAIPNRAQIQRLYTHCPRVERYERVCVEPSASRFGNPPNSPPWSRRS